jgi:hypothetical protein
VSGNVAARVAWLLEEPRPRRCPTGVLVVAASLAGTGALVQAHHLADFLVHLH